MKRRTREHQKKVEKLVKAFKRLEITTTEEQVSQFSTLFERVSIATPAKSKQSDLRAEVRPCNPLKS